MKMQQIPILNMSYFHKKKSSTLFFIIHGLPMGGAEKFLIALINHVQKKMGNVVLILLGGENTLINEVNENIEVIEIKKRFRLDIRMLMTLRGLYRKRKPTKVFCINAYSFFMARVASIGKNDMQFYLSPHTTVAFSTKNDILSRVFFRLFGKKDTAIFLCHFQMRYMRNKYLSDRGKSLVIYNGIDTKYYDPRHVSKEISNQIRNGFGIHEDEFMILNVARISREKGHDHAIEALSMLHEIYGIKAHLLFVGNGEKQLIQSLERMIENKGIKQFVHFAGMQKDVRPYYKACDIFTLTSTSETFSLSALEAMSFGKACVLTEVGGAREMIEPNKNGLLARVTDPGSIARAWNHLLSRPMMDQQNIRKDVKMKFDVKNMLNAYVDVLNHNDSSLAKTY